MWVRVLSQPSFLGAYIALLRLYWHFSQESVTAFWPDRWGCIFSVRPLLRLRQPSGAQRANISRKIAWSRELAVEERQQQSTLDAGAGIMT